MLRVSGTPRPRPAARRAAPAARLVLAACWALCAAPGAARADDAQAMLAAHGPEVREELDKEGMVLLPSDGDGKFITALVLFDKPPDVALDLLRQTARQGEFRPELKKTETMEQMPDGSVELQQLRILFTNIRYHLRYRVDPETRRITWQLHEELENDLSEVSGFWELHPMEPDRTLARFGTRVDVGGLPEFLQDYATRKNVPKTLENTRKWVNSGGTWRH